jgi:hypothetical protein
MLADPRVQEAIRQWEEEENALRDSVRNYLSDLSKAS